MFNLKKKNVALLLKCALELNSFINKYTDERIKNMTRSQLILVCYELILNDSDSLKLKQYTIKDIKDHLYILEGQKIDFKWCEEIPDESYNLPTTIYKTLTHFECYIVDNGILKNKIYIGDERQWVKVNLETLNPDKLDGFYISFMDKIAKESIFSKIEKVKKELL